MPLGSTVAFRPMRSPTSVYRTQHLSSETRLCSQNKEPSFRLVGYSEVGPRERTGKQRWKHRMATFHCIRFSPDIFARGNGRRKASRLCISFFESEGQEDFEKPITPNCFGMNGGDDETRTRDLCRDRAAF